MSGGMGESVLMEAGGNTTNYGRNALGGLTWALALSVVIIVASEGDHPGVLDIAGALDIYLIPCILLILYCAV